MDPALLSPGDDLVTALRERGVGRGVPVAVAVGSGVVGLATAGWALGVGSGAGLLAAVEEELAPRWVWWGQSTAGALVAAGVRPATCWDVAAVQRVLDGGWRADPARVWAKLHGLDHRAAPSLGQLDLLSAAADVGDSTVGPVQRDGYLRPEWVGGSWAGDPLDAARWAGAAFEAQRLQRERVDALPRADQTVRVESAAELLCAELAHDGLPVDRTAAEALLTELIGPRPSTEKEADEQRARRDAEVLDHLPPGSGIDLRNPADVKTLLRRLGIDVPDTRAWRLRALADTHPAVAALLHWRKVERIATTFGYGWLDSHVGIDGRLRGEWSASDGAAGRMTAQAGLHNLPAELRTIVRAEPGHLFVRADLGQIEPRVRAAVSGDGSLRTATQEDDLYAPVARRLGVERPVAKVAVLAAMYGQTSGTAGQALRGMEAAYPTAIAYLSDAAQAGFDGRELRTYGGRRIRMYDIDGAGDHRAAAAARGRYARNAMVQGAAAELFKMWAVTVRARGAALGARIVLCLHDELLVHVPAEHAPAAATLLDDCLAEAAARWQQGAGVRFVADVSTVASWADAK